MSHLPMSVTMSEEKEFNIEGTMRKGPRRIFFRQTLDAPNEKMAIERAYALIGSRHRAKRNQIKFTKVEEKKAQ